MYLKHGPQFSSACMSIVKLQRNKKHARGIRVPLSAQHFYKFVYCKNHSSTGTSVIALNFAPLFCRNYCSRRWQECHWLQCVSLEQIVNHNGNVMPSIRRRASSQRYCTRAPLSACLETEPSRPRARGESDCSRSQISSNSKCISFQRDRVQCECPWANSVNPSTSTRPPQQHQPSFTWMGDWEHLMASGWEKSWLSDSLNYL